MEYHQIFTIHRQDSIRFFWYQIRRAWLPGMAGFGLVGALVTRLYSTGRFTGGAMASIMVLAGLGVFFAALLIGYLAARQKAPRSTYTQEVTINGFGVQVAANGAQSRVGFDKLYAVHETGKDFYLFLSRDHAWLLCKEQMADPAADSAALRALFRQVIESKRLRLR